jgi:hypothetical protein
MNLRQINRLIDIAQGISIDRQINELKEQKKEKHYFNQLS